jgi:hypothetical protein
MSETRTADLSSQVDGINNSFTTPDIYVSGTLIVHVNGLRLTPDEYTETGTTTFTVGGVEGYPTPLPAVECLLVQYEIPSSALEGVVASGIPPGICC